MYVLFGHGRPEQEYAGVGLVTRKDLRKYITGFELGAEGRVLVVALDMAPRRLSIITAYIPQSRRPEEERAGVMGQLAKVVDTCQNMVPPS